MTQRLASGCPRLDTILGGGLVQPSITLVTGLPGTGKTVLAQQYTFANARPDRPVVYLSSLTEPLTKITQFLGGLRFCDPNAIGTSVLFEDLGDIVTTGGLAAGLDRITEIATHTQCGMLVVDSVRALRYATRDQTDYTRFLYELGGRLSALATSTLWLAEYGAAELEPSPEFAIADAVIQLSTQVSGQRTSRALQVLKLRGSAYLPGWHTYRVSADGLDAFPRLADTGEAVTAEPPPTARVSSGVPALDRLLGEGYWPGASTIVLGPPGVGKTVMGLQFVYDGAEPDQHATFTTLQENHVQLGRAIRSLGWDPEDSTVSLRCESPNGLYIDQWFYDLVGSLEASGTRRLVIDSLTDLATTCEDERRFTEFVRSLLARCSLAGISTLLTLEVPELFGQVRLPDTGVTHLTDNVLMLYYQPNGTTFDRVMTVLKTRASASQCHTSQFEITGRGIEMHEQADGS